MEHFSALPKAYINSTIQSRQLHAVFFYLFSDYRKQDSATTTAHIKRFIELLKDKTLLTASLSTIWENADGCAEQYRCALNYTLCQLCRSFTQL